MDQASATGETSARKFSRAEWWMPAKRWALIGLGIGGAIAGLASGWDWVVAAGLAPLVVSVLPNGNAGQSAQSPSQAQATERPRPEIPS